MVQDPYSDKNGVLFNKAGITDAEKLREYEYHTVAGAQVALMNNPPKGNFDMDHLKAVHKGLFGGVYKWAGETRTVDIWKGNTTFAKASMIDGAGDKFPVLMEWPGPQDGILCEPQSGGKIDGTNLFGTSTGFTDGYEALRVKDTDGDGKVQGEELSGLAVWTDLNSDARPQEGEVRSLRELGITELGLKHNQYVSHYVRDSKSQRMFDWWPQTYELNRVKLMPKKS